MSSTDTIKNCPHCGGVSYLNSNYNYKARSYFVFVKCEICGATGKTYNAKEEPSKNGWNTPECNSAVEAWNMRTHNYNY